MTKSRFFILLSVLFVLSALAGAGEWKSVSVSDFNLEWQVDGDMLNLKLSAPTEGWIAVGFDPSKAMKDANILIGYFENGSATVSDQFGNSVFSHKEDEQLGGRSDVTNVSGSESDGVTRLAFTIPLDSGDSADKPLREGQSYKVIFASHTRDRISMKHNRRTSVEITL